MVRKRMSLSIGILILAMGLLAACGASPTATLAPVSSAAPSAAGSAAPSAAATSAASSPGATRAASPVVSTPSTGSPTVGTPTRAASPGTPTGSPTRAATPGTPGAGTPTSGFSPSQAYVRLGGQPSHRQRWNFTGFTVAGLSGNLAPVFDVVGNSRKVSLPDVAGITLEAYQIGGVISVPNPIGGGYAAADPSNPLAAPAQALFALPDVLIFTLAPVNASYTQQGTQTVNGRTTLVYRAQVPLADLGFVSPALQGQTGMAMTTLYLDSTLGYLVALESTIQAGTSGTAATARLDVTDVGQVPEIVLPQNTARNVSQRGEESDTLAQGGGVTLRHPGLVLCRDCG